MVEERKEVADRSWDTIESMLSQVDPCAVFSDESIDTESDALMIVIQKMPKLADPKEVLLFGQDWLLTQLADAEDLSDGDGTDNLKRACMWYLAVGVLKTGEPRSPSLHYY